MSRLAGSVRARLTAWNGGVLAVILLGLAGATYALLAHESVEQVDDMLRQQMRTAQLTIVAHQAPPTGDAKADEWRTLWAVTEELQRRGFRVALAEGDLPVLATRPMRGERAASRLRQETGGDARRPAPLPVALLRAIDVHHGSGTFTVPGPRGGVRVRLEPATIGGKSFTVAATESLDEVDELLTLVRDALLVAIPLVLAVALAAGYLLARRALAPVAAMTEQARRIGARTLHERLRVANPHDELGRLAATFNEALDRVDRALDQQRRFTADASHELRTPIAIIRSEADVALAAPSRAPDEYRDALGVIREGSERLSRIVNDLFLLARADAGQVAATRRPLYLDELATDTVRSMRSLAAARGVELTVDAPVETPYCGDEELLRRVLVNLLDNATRYAPDGSAVGVTLRSADDGHRLTVSDVGPGVPDEARPFVFDRFFRAEPARAREAARDGTGTGAGLGLSIAREIAELHGGRLTLAESRGPGAAVELFLPNAS